MKQPRTPEQGDGVRLARCVAALQGCSRREAELLIEAGQVRVDGIVVEELPFRVQGQTVTVDSGSRLTEIGPVTLLLHKLPGLDGGTGEIVSIKGLGKGLRPVEELLQPPNRWPGDRSELVPLKKHFTKQTLYLPLETGASGLVVFAQDWRIARKLEEDAAVIEQEFTVEIRGAVAPNQIEQLNRLATDAASRLPHFKASITSSDDKVTRLRFAVKGSHPGLMGWLCDRMDLPLVGMKRIRIGRLPMADLPAGQWRYLLPYERF